MRITWDPNKAKINVTIQRKNEKEVKKDLTGFLPKILFFSLRQRFSIAVVLRDLINRQADLKSKRMPAGTEKI